MSALIMEKDLNLALELVRGDVRVKYLNKGSVDVAHGFRELD
jgi:hypothetical protein